MKYVKNYANNEERKFFSKHLSVVTIDTNLQNLGHFLIEQRAPSALTKHVSSAQLQNTKTGNSHRKRIICEIDATLRNKSAKMVFMNLRLPYFLPYFTF